MCLFHAADKEIGSQRSKPAREVKQEPKESGSAAPPPALVPRPPLVLPAPLSPAVVKQSLAQRIKDKQDGLKQLEKVDVQESLDDFYELLNGPGLTEKAKDGLVLMQQDFKGITDKLVETTAKVEGDTRFIIDYDEISKNVEAWGEKTKAQPKEFKA